jgi:hypothetical protein
MIEDAYECELTKFSQEQEKKLEAKLWNHILLLGRVYIL